MIRDIPCLCGHRKDKHTEMNRNAWNRFFDQLKGYKDSPRNREKFYHKFLTGGSSDEWRCNDCDCEAFKQDNLKFLEEKAKEKKHD